MPEIEFEGGQMVFRDSGSSRLDWSVAITDYELRQVASTLSAGQSLPVALRSGSADPGDMVDPVLVLVPTASDMPALVALARMRDARMGPHYPEGVDGAQEADQPQGEPVPAPGPDRRLESAADDMQERVEAFLSNLGVDPDKYDHQNHAGDLVTSILGVLRRHDYLQEPVSADDGQRPPLRRMLNMGECSTLRHRIHMAAPAGLGPAQITEITGRVLSLLRRWTDGELEPEPALPPNAWRITRDYYLSNRQDVVSAVAKGISTASVSTLQETQQIRRQIMERLDALFESRGVAG